MVIRVNILAKNKHFERTSRNFQYKLLMREAEAEYFTIIQEFLRSFTQLFEMFVWNVVCLFVVVLLFDTYFGSPGVEWHTLCHPGFHFYIYF